MKLKFNVTGMTCAACSARVEKVAGAVAGVEKVEVNLLRGTMTLEADSPDCAEAVIRNVCAAGYGAALAGQKASAKEQKEPRTSMKSRIIGSAVFLIILMYVTMGHMVGLPMPAWYTGTENALTATLLQFFLILPPVFLNRAYFEKGLKSLLKS